MSPSHRILFTLLAACLPSLVATTASAAPERTLVKPALAPRGTVLTGAELVRPAAGLHVWGHAFMMGTKEFTSAVAVEID